MKKITLIAGVTALLIVGYAAAGPYLTASAIKDGIENKDSEALSENIEFAQLRQNLKDQVNAQLVTKAADQAKDNPFAALLTGLATKLTDSVIDSMVTPSGIAAIASGEKPAQSDQNTEVSQQPEKKELFKNARHTFDSLSKFSTWVPNKENQEIRFVLKRDLFTWKLVNIVIPDISPDPGLDEDFIQQAVDDAGH